MEDTPERQKIIDRMLAIVREDAPWIWGMVPKDYQLNHSWLSNLKPNQMARNSLKYLEIDAKLRDERRHQWNRPEYWPFAALCALFLAIAIPAYLVYRRREDMKAR